MLREKARFVKVADNLPRVGLNVEHIMKLGVWGSLDMVLRYTRSVKFEESLCRLSRLLSFLTSDLGKKIMPLRLSDIPGQKRSSG